VSEKCAACERPQPKDKFDMDGRPWMTCLVGHLYCPTCFDAFVTREHFKDVGNGRD
jgi:hypothetical protein